MDANVYNIANITAAKKRVAQLKVECDAVNRRIVRDTATVATIELQINALEGAIPADTDTAVS